MRPGTRSISDSFAVTKTHSCFTQIAAIIKSCKGISHFYRKKFTPPRAIQAQIAHSKPLIHNHISATVKITISEWDANLPPSLFKRISRSTLVNVKSIASLTDPQSRPSSGCVSRPERADCFKPPCISAPAGPTDNLLFAPQNAFAQSRRSRR